jgi:hypothetical protein
VYTTCSSKDSLIFSAGEEFTVVCKGNVQISFGANMSIFLHVYYVLGTELNLLSTSQIMRHYAHLDVNFSNHKCYVADKETKKTIALSCGGSWTIQTGSH